MLNASKAGGRQTELLSDDGSGKESLVLEKGNSGRGRESRSGKSTTKKRPGGSNEKKKGRRSGHAKAGGIPKNIIRPARALDPSNNADAEPALRVKKCQPISTMGRGMGK